MFISVKSLLSQHNGRVRLLEAHDKDSFEIAKGTSDDNGNRFHGVWMSGLTQTTLFGLPDTELISPLNRASMLSWLSDCEERSASSVCISFDCDSGGDIAEVRPLVAVLARVGVSMIVIEDKVLETAGAKVNSLGMASHRQQQANIDDFTKILGVFAQATVVNRSKRSMMITARIESFTVRIPEGDHTAEAESVQKCLEDALLRAHLYRQAGADAIMIHSKSVQPQEILAFLKQFRSQDVETPLVVIPTTYSSVAEERLYEAGANIIIYANHLMRAKIRAVENFYEYTLRRHPYPEAKKDKNSETVTYSFLHKADMQACIAARNFSCMIRKLGATCMLDDELAAAFLAEARFHAIRAMTDVVQCILQERKAAAADSYLISVQDLLTINSRQITVIEDLRPSKVISEQCDANE